MSNTFGSQFRLTTFGESHGQAIGGIIDGMPAGINIDIEALQRAMNRRRPGQSNLTTSRNEKDHVEILSGVFDGVTTGTPIAFSIQNSDARSADYENIRNIFRPSHADFTYTAKYGIRDFRGGGRASARETAVRVAAGELARQALSVLCPSIEVKAWTAAIGNISYDAKLYPNIGDIESNNVRCPDKGKAAEMELAILDAQTRGESLGGIVECCITGAPVGLGEPLYDKLQARLAYAMMSIPAAKGFDYGDGFRSLHKPGSEWVDQFIYSNDMSEIAELSDLIPQINTLTNHSGGIQGGISNGMPIELRVGFKPIATLMHSLETIDNHGRPVSFTPRGRHDVCVIPRAVPVVEAMAWLVVMDQWLLSKLSSVSSITKP